MGFWVSNYTHYYLKCEALIDGPSTARHPGVGRDSSVSLLGADTKKSDKNQG